VFGPDDPVDAPAGTLALPLVFHGSLVGTLVAGGREVGPADWRALEDLAPSLAASLHAARLADDLRASRERIVNAREEERRRLRADLHDDVGPSLAMLALRLDAAAAGTGGGATPEMLRELGGQTRDTLARVRQIVTDLRPAALADLGLEAALASAVDHIQTARLDVPAPLGALPAATEVAAYRIAREALSNVVRHARAGSCVVRLAREGEELVVTVSDDGRGISADGPRGVGLGSMAERADELGGTLTVTTRPDVDGTVIEARLPA
jgi:signal transduction histidine kinase